MRNFVLAAAVCLLAAACGSSGTGPAPNPGPGVGFDVSVTEKDHAATLHVGQTIQLVLHEANGMTPWNHPRSSNTAILTPIADPAATSVRGVTVAAFKAVVPGDAEVSSYAGPDCSPGQVCPMFVAVYSLKVSVQA